MTPTAVKISLLLLFHTLFSVADPLRTYDLAYALKGKPDFIKYELFTPRLGKRVHRKEEADNKLQRDFSNFPSITWENSNPEDVQPFQVEE